MKILIAHNAYQSTQIGGEDIVVSKEIAAIQAYLGAENVWQYQVNNDNIKTGPLLKNLWGDKHHARNIAQLVREQGIAIVHVHNFFPLLTPSIFKAAHQAGAVVVHTLHNYRWWCPAGIVYRPDIGHCESCLSKSFAWPAVLHGCYRNSRLQSLAVSLAFQWYKIKNYARYIDAYFVLSQLQQEKISQHLPVKKIHLKPNFIDKPLSALAPEKKKHYLFVGRLEKAKGIELLLATWVKLPAHFCLQIIGNAELRPDLMQAYRRPNIDFLGPLSHEQVQARMREAKYLLHLSIMIETFGLTIIEALSVGTPVIGLNIGTRKEFVQTGVNGFLCEPEQLTATILAAEHFTAYPVLCQQAIESAKPFLAEAVVAKQYHLYQQLWQQKKVLMSNV